jgi:hypothetical protein
MCVTWDPPPKREHDVTDPCHHASTVKSRGLGGGSQAFEPPADETGALIFNKVPQPTIMGGMAEFLQSPAFDLAHALPTELQLAADVL